MKVRDWCASVVGVAVLSAAVGSAEGQVVRVVARTGLAAPRQGYVYGNAFVSPQTNDAGDVAFRATISDGSGGLMVGLWVDRGRRAEAVGIVGLEAEGLPPGVVVTSLDQSVLDDSGASSTWGAVSSPSQGGLLRRRSGGPMEILSSYGTAAPGGSVGTLWRGPTAYAGAGGKVLTTYRMFVSDGRASDSALAYSDTGPLRVLVQGGSQAAGFGAGWYYAEMGAALLDGNGHLAFSGNARLASPSAVTPAIWEVTPAGAATLAAAVGQRAPTSNPNDHFASLGDAFMSREGVLSFIARSEPGYGVFQKAPGRAAALALPTVVTVSGMAPEYHGVLNNSVRVSASARAFAAIVSEVNAQNMFFGRWLAAGTAQGMRGIARVGSPAPGFPDSFVLSAVSQFAVNDRGQVVFQGVVSQSGSAGLYALWATDLSGQVRVLAVQGSPLRAPGDIERVVSGISLAYLASDSLAVGRTINNAGQVVFALTFADGTAGVYVADFAERCRGDFNGDGGVDGGDVEAFFVAWEGGGVEADVNGDGAVNGEDVGAFLELWDEGC